MRHMSFALTRAQFLDGSKTVTRRVGWRFLKAGDHFMAVEKAMGLKKGEKVVRLGPAKVISIRRERLDAITDDDVAREGFADMTADEFIAMFCKHMRVTPDAIVTRIEFQRDGDVS